MIEQFLSQSLCHFKEETLPFLGIYRTKNVKNAA